MCVCVCARARACACTHDCHNVWLARCCFESPGMLVLTRTPQQQKQRLPSIYSQYNHSQDTLHLTLTLTLCTTAVTNICAPNTTELPPSTIQLFVITHITPLPPLTPTLCTTACWHSPLNIPKKTNVRLNQIKPDHITPFSQTGWLLGI